MRGIYHPGLVLLLLPAAALALYAAWRLAGRIAARRHGRDEARRLLDGSIERLDSALVRLETVDPLTELPNRATLVEHLELALARAGRQGVQLAVLFMDLDGFKTINDTLGHSAGDALLQAFAQRLRQVVRKRDLVARLGGDEFVVVLEGLRSADDAGRVALAVLGAMQRNLVVADSALLVTPSVGIAMYPRDGDTVEGLLRNADIAMYAAKQDGRNTYRQYEPDMGERAMRQMMIQRGLQDALALGEMSLAFQPKFTGPTHSLTGAEALIRWNHRELGAVAPDEFIPMAERSGLILEIGQWVVREVCKQLQLWQEQGLPAIKVAVNLSPRQMQQPDLAGDMARLVGQAGIETSRILFEITEVVAMQDAERSAQVIRALHEQGFGVAIDDFGTGYSSLAYLQQFRVQQIKIDRFFTHGLDAHGEEGMAIVSAIVALAHSLKMEVVAEGVETSSQANKLRQLACDQMQGYLLARPLNAEQFRDFLRDNRDEDRSDGGGDPPAPPRQGLEPMSSPGA